MRSSGRILHKWGRTVQGSGRSMPVRTEGARCGDESHGFGGESHVCGDELCPSGAELRGSADEVDEVRVRLRVNGGRMRQSGDEPAAGGHETGVDAEAVRAVPAEA